MKKILLVDDQANFTTMMAIKLKSMGFEIFIAANGKEALDIVQTQTPDLIVMDVMMPVLDGFSAVEIMRRNAKFASTPVIFLSAKGQQSDRARATELGAIDFMAKPFSPKELVVKIEKLFF